MFFAVVEFLVRCVSDHLNLTIPVIFFIIINQEKDTYWLSEDVHMVPSTSGSFYKDTFFLCNLIPSYGM